MCDIHMQFGSHTCSVMYAYMELMIYIELYIDNCYTHLSLYLDNLPMYTNNVITLW